MATRDVRWAYEVLGLPLGSAPDDVRQAYRDLITVWHPDRFQNNPRLRDQSNKKAQEINAAFALLRDLKSSGPSATKKLNPHPPHRVRRQTTHIGDQRMPPVSAMEGTGMTSIRVGKRRSDAASARAADRRGSWNAWTVSTAAQSVTRDSP